MRWNGIRWSKNRWWAERPWADGPDSDRTLFAEIVELNGPIRVAWDEKTCGDRVRSGDSSFDASGLQPESVSHAAVGEAIVPCRVGVEIGELIGVDCGEYLGWGVVLKQSADVRVGGFDGVIEREPGGSVGFGGGRFLVGES